MSAHPPERRAGLWLAALFVIAAVSVSFGFSDRAGQAGSRDLPTAGSGDQDAASPAQLDLGAQVYAERCQLCHGRDGAGGVAPKLAGGAAVARFPDPAEMVAFVLAGSEPGRPYGQGGEGTGGMPPWENVLSDEEVAAVVAYERSR
ncbi:MAG: hypothetical protein JJLCMIEE_01100 [Acidimicrobiales bacterium]|nr:MAG: cytochrome c [Actinomycetota bacterium]MBV6508041.1 hypothetical protein [Acidimicrobiales bacterium]RIK05331.1 MAG: hypothetical protein DCC48_10665 [Acidobacteriota bacterium]